MNENIIVAIVGMCGSGKSEATAIFEKDGFYKVYFGGIVIEKLKEKGSDINEKNEKEMRQKLREEHGMEAFAKLNIPKIDEALERGSVVIDGLYSQAEYDLLIEKYGERLKLLCIYVTKKIRYDRLGSRKERPLTKEECNERDLAEIKKSDKGGPIALADYMIINESTIEDLEENIDELITKVLF